MKHSFFSYISLFCDSRFWIDVSYIFRYTLWINRYTWTYNISMDIFIGNLKLPYTTYLLFNNLTNESLIKRFRLSIIIYVEITINQKIKSFYSKKSIYAQKFVQNQSYLWYIAQDMLLKIALQKSLEQQHKVCATNTQLLNCIAKS